MRGKENKLMVFQPVQVVLNELLQHFPLTSPL